MSTTGATAAEETRALLAWVHGLRLAREKSYARAYWRWLRYAGELPPPNHGQIGQRRANQLQTEVDRRMPGMRATHAAEAEAYAARGSLTWD